MVLKIGRMDVWVGELQDVPGALAGKLSMLAEAKANLQFVLARRAPEKPGTGVVFLAPIRGARQQAAAERAGLRKSESIFALRIEGSDKPGLGAKMSAALGDAGISIRGLSAAVIGSRCVVHLALDGADDAANAARLLRKL